MEEVSNDICAKLIHRHPHVFGTVEVANSAEVLKNWDAIKGEEKQRITMTDKLRAIPPMYPSLMRAQKVGKKAACFDFANADEVYRKLDEEIAEVKAAAEAGDQAAVEEELGDLLLTVTSLARKLGVKSEEALFHATNKFIDRFERVENAVIGAGKDMESLTMAELDAIWDEIKHQA
jgi:tetrapyrrole methylase family protein/MazG family protein